MCVTNLFQIGNIVISSILGVQVVMDSVISKLADSKAHIRQGALAVLDACLLDMNIENLIASLSKELTSESPIARLEVCQFLLKNNTALYSPTVSVTPMIKPVLDLVSVCAALEGAGVSVLFSHANTSFFLEYRIDPLMFANSHLSCW